MGGMRRRSSGYVKINHQDLERLGAMVDDSELVEYPSRPGEAPPVAAAPDKPPR